MDIEILGDNFIEFQKEIFQEYFAQLEDAIQEIKPDNHKAIKIAFETILQNLNSKLTVFADKMSNTHYFPIKGSIKIYVQDILFASLIGNTSILIFRDRGLYYSVNNEYGQQGKIDLFSEFIEGEVANQDKIILLGNDIHVVFDKKEIKKFNDIFVQGDHDTMDFLEETLSMRVEKTEISYIIQDTFGGLASHQTSPQAGSEGKKQNKRLSLLRFNKSSNNNKTSSYNFLETSKTHKYRIVVGILGLLTLTLMRSAISGNNGNNKPVYIDQVTGVEKTISPDQIKKDITYFQKLDPSSDEKSHLYREIITQLDRLDSQSYRPEDIEKWRRILEQHYNKGFNIVYETALSNFDDELSNTKAQLLAFTDEEKNTIGSPTSLIMTHQLLVGGSDGGMIGPVNENIRGTAVSNGGVTSYIGCTSNILRDGLYCYDEVGNISNITKAGTVDVTTESPGGFPSNVAGLDIFGKTNLYVLTNDTFDNQDGIFLTRYRNIVGTQNQFQIGDNYLLPLGSGDQVPEVNNFAIDGNFLVRNNQSKTIQQRRREGATFTLNSRTIDVIGGTDSLSDMGSDISLLSTINTRYVLLFDQENQALTVYDTTGLKTNDAYSTNYSLKYLMKFKFDLSNETIVDMAITDADGNKLRLYVLTDIGVYKIKLYDFIDEIINADS